MVGVDKTVAARVNVIGAPMRNLVPEEVSQPGQYEAATETVSGSVRQEAEGEAKLSDLPQYRRVEAAGQE
jgi:hypothetical protein